MKKVLVAAAGLALVGTMATSAMAEFKFSGDARARFFYEANYDQPTITAYEKSDDSATVWSSRTRFKIEADTKGGAYVKTRVRLADASWDGTANTRNRNNNIYTDYAYIGVPMGMVTAEAGLITRDVTPFFYFDGRADSFQLKYKADNTGLVAFYDLIDEGDIDNSGDDNWYGFLLNQGFEGGWNLTVGGLYSEQDGDNGAGVTVGLQGNVGEVALAAELAFQNEELNGIADANDDGFGGYVQATMPVGPVSLMGMVGFTLDGYNIDEADFGPFIILQDYSQIALGTDFSEYGESIFAAIAPTFQATEKLTLGAQFSYVNVDAYATGADDADLFELGATASYAVTDGAKLNGIVGWASVDDLAEDDPFAVGLELAISF